jgi:hypothetical protein
MLKVTRNNRARHPLMAGDSAELDPRLPGLAGTSFAGMTFGGDFGIVVSFQERV